MPSFTSIATLALTLFSASSALASGFGTVEADLAARDNLNGGSLFEKRWNNHGKECSPKKKNWCKTDVTHGEAWCGKSKHGYACEWGCKKGYSKHGSKCVANKPTASCKQHHHCKTSVKHAWAYCNAGKCGYECDKGYHASGGKCVATKAVTCGKHHCPAVQDGWASCSKKGACEQHCHTENGWKLYTNKHKTAYRCINTWSDKNNCGKPGHVCGYGYHHKGEPICWKGECSLNCHGYRVAKTHSGVLYCSNKKA